jgi:osmotically-inducible protein OsmY
MFFEKFTGRHNGHPSDADITAIVRETLFSYGPLESTHPFIQININGGVVTLRGVVRGAGQRDIAGQLAAAVEGVVAVRNELVDDPSLEGEIGRELATHPLLRLSTTRITIKSFNGVVTLRGPVLNHIQQITAEAVTRRVMGVRKVVNRLVVLNNQNSRWLTKGDRS